MVPCIQIDNVLPDQAGRNLRFKVTDMFDVPLVTDSAPDAGPFNEQREFAALADHGCPGYTFGNVPRVPVSSAICVAALVTTRM